MSENIRMSVSSLTRTETNKAVYVLFEDGKKTAEFALPELKLLRNEGFSEEEIDRLREYADGERESIFSMAKAVDPMKAFLGK